MSEQPQARDATALVQALEDADQFPIMVGPSHYNPKRERWSLPMSLFRPHEIQAQRNHGQTLDRLREREGLSASEALAILEDRPWREMPFSQALNGLIGAATAALRALPRAGLEETQKPQLELGNGWAYSGVNPAFFATLVQMHRTADDWIVFTFHEGGEIRVPIHPDHVAVLVEPERH